MPELSNEEFLRANSLEMVDKPGIGSIVAGLCGEAQLRVA